MTKLTTDNNLFSGQNIVYPKLAVWFSASEHTRTYLGFKVRADPDNTSLDSHLEGEADDPSDL